MTHHEEGPLVVRPDLPDITYMVSEIPLKTGGRRDVTVHTQRPVAGDSTASFMSDLRTLFGAIMEESDRYAADPYTNVQALAKLEVILGDARVLRDHVRKHVANALFEQKVRRLTVEHVITVEASSEGATRQWNDAKLLADILTERGLILVDKVDGEVISPAVLADELLRYFSVSWRLTPLREDGFDEDRYSTIQRDDPDDDAPPGTVGKIKRIPSVKVIDNAEKRA